MELILYSSDSSRKNEQLSFLDQLHRRSLQKDRGCQRNEEGKEKGPTADAWPNRRPPRQRRRRTGERCMAAALTQVATAANEWLTRVSRWQKRVWHARGGQTRGGEMTVLPPNKDK